MGDRPYDHSDRILFLSHVAPPDRSGCRLWTGPARRGCGRFRVPGRDQMSHRAAAEMSGMDISGMDVTRSCGVRLCCEPTHFVLRSSCERECVVTPWTALLSRLVGARGRSSGMDSRDLAFVSAVEGHGSVASAAASAGISVEMTRYNARRIATRSRALSIRLRGLDALERNMDEALSVPVLTRQQADTLLLVLSGLSQSEAATRLGVIQASVSSRVSLARNSLRSHLGRGWALRVHRSIRVMRRVVNVRGNQVKPASWHRAKSGTPE